MDIISVKDLEYIYSDGTKVCFGSESNFTIKKGEKVALLGANGSGKSTLLSLIMGLLKPSKGKVEVSGHSPSRDFKKVRKKLGVIFQNVDEQIIGPRVYDDIAFSLRQSGMDRAEIDERVSNVTSLLGIEDKLNKIPHYLSGGEKQKVALAGALSHDPDILILDEPLDSLDIKSRREVEDILNKLNRDKGVTIILTSHEVNWISRFADTIYLLSNGKIISKGCPEEVLIDEGKLLESGLEPPVLVSFFKRLREKGLNTKIPVRMDEAEKIMDAYLDFNNEST